MRFLVTGAAGFIGSHVTEALVASGHDVTGIDCYDTTLRDGADRAAFVAAMPTGSWTFHRTDVKQFCATHDVGGFDVVVHLAATPGLSPSWAQQDAYWANNVGQTQALADAVAASPTVQRVIHASTSSVYGRFAVGDEGTPTRPVSPYGETKLAAELVWSRPVADPRVSILRFFSVYGPRQRPDMAFARFIDNALQHRPLPVTGDGTQERSFTYVGDASRAVELAAMPNAPSGTYNIAGSRVVSVNESLAVIGELLDMTPIVLRTAARPGDQEQTGGDASKARDLLGWTPTVDLRSGLRAQIAATRSRVTS